MDDTTKQALERALKVWECLNVNVTAIAAGGKRPRYGWKRDVTKRQTAARVRGLPWQGSKSITPATAVGIIHSDAVGCVRALDIDPVIDKNGEKVEIGREVAERALEALGLPPTYLWLLRSSSGKGWHIYFRCAPPPPPIVERDGGVNKRGIIETKLDYEGQRYPRTGIVVGAPLDPDTPVKQIELRWHRHYTVLAPDVTLPLRGSFAGNPPVLTHTLPPLAELTFEQVERGFLAIASVVDNEQPKKDPPPKKEGGAVAGIIDAFNNRYSAKELLERNRYRWVGDGWAHPDSSLPQTAGVKPEGDRVRSYSASDPLNDGRHSHDAFSIYTILEHHGDERAAVRSAAELLGFNEASCPPTTPPRGGCADPVPQETTVAAPKPIEDITAYTTILPDHIANYEPPHHPGSQDEILQYLLSGDKGDAQLFAQCVGDTVAYDSSAGKWYVFANGHWQIDNYGWIRAILSDTLTSAYEPLWETLDNEDDKHERKTLSGKLTDLATTAGTNSVLKFAQPYLALKAEWDSNPYLLGVKNGVVDLRTGEHRPCTPQDYIRTVAPTEYDKEATAPRWLTFIDEIADSQEIAGYMQRVLGYATYGLTTEHIMLILYGPNGRNGKDTLLKALQRTLGSAIASTVSPDCIIEHRDRGGGPTPHLLDLRGKRMAVVNESRRTAHLNGAQVKQITGGGQISARGLYEGQVTFFPTHTVFLITNHKPSADSDDEALWERVHLIGFNKRFVNKPAAANELPADKYLDERLQQEAPGILTWLVQGAVAYWQHGLQTPDSVMIATRAMKNENDYIGMFVDDRCLIGDGYTVKASLLYERYKEWAGNNGYRPMTNKTFTQRLLNKYPIEKKKTKQHIEYHGIALTY